MRASVKAAATALLGCALSGCAASSTFLAPSSPIASREAWLFWVVVGMAAVVFVLVEGLIVLVVIRDRQRGADEGEPRQVYGNRNLEIVWTAIPVLLVITLFGLTVGTMRAVAAPGPSSSDLNITVIGHRWWWEFDYPDLNIKTAEELHIPAGKNVQITLKSVDVIHSFWVPQLAGKTDVIPGQVNHMWLRSDQVGTYDGQCAEFCGAEHALMRFHVVVDSPTDFQAWVAGQQRPVPAAQTDQEQRGQDIVLRGPCIACHTIDGTSAQGTLGPNLTHLSSRSTFAGGAFSLTDANLRQWLKDPQAMKPGNDMVVALSDPDIEAVIAYLKLLR